MVKNDVARNLGKQVPGRKGRYASAAGLSDIAEDLSQREPDAAPDAHSDPQRKASAATSRPVERADHRETADGYRGELFRMGRYRVAVCRQGRQWLYQRQRPGSPAGGAAWDTLGYCLNRSELMGLHRSHVGADSPEIALLPEYFTAGDADE